MNKYWFILSFGFLGLSSCEEPDVPVAPNVPSDAIEDDIAMGSDYDSQIFYDLGTASEVASSSRTDWDLGFESSSNGDRIILNSSRRMRAFNTGDTDFVTAYQVDGSEEWVWDHPTGSLNLTAIGDWRNSDGSSKNEVYLIDLGLDNLGQNLGYRKMQIVGLQNDTYQIRYANLDGSNEITASITKNTALNFSAYSMIFEAPMTFEPNRNDWDILFTNYTESLWDGTDTVSYQVTGAITNRPNGVEVAEVTEIPFDSLTLEMTVNLQFSSSQNTIGYDWKYFNFDAQTYDVLDDLTYVIRDTEGTLYKLRFVGWYDEQGLKGNPAFEFQEL